MSLSQDLNSESVTTFTVFNVLSLVVRADETARAEVERDVPITKDNTLKVCSLLSIYDENKLRTYVNGRS